MRLHRQQTAITTVILTILSATGLWGWERSAEEILSEARNLYYRSVDDEAMIQPAIDKFEQLKSSWPAYSGRAQVYIGALYAIRAKHVFLPNEKLSWANQGLARIDAGLRTQPNDLESLFVHGSVCNQLPFFFNRGDDAERDFDRIIELLPSEHGRFNRLLINDIFNFLIDKADLPDAKLAIVKVLRKKLGYS